MLRCQRQAGCGFKLVDRGIDIEAERARRSAQEFGERGRSLDFRLMRGGQAHAHAAIAEGFAHHEIAAFQTRQRFDDLFFVDAEQFAGCDQQLLLGDMQMAVLEIGVEHMHHAGLEARRRIFCQAKFGRDGIGGAKPDAPYFDRQAIRVLADLVDRVFAVALDDARGEPRRDAMAAQEHHDVLGVAMLGPGRGDLARTRCADAIDLDEPLRIARDDFQRIHAKARDHAARQFGTDAGDQACTKEAFNADQRLGTLELVRADFELAAVFLIDDPGAAQPQWRTIGHANQGTDNGGLAWRRSVANAVDVEPCDGEMTFVIVKHHAAQGAIEGDLVGWAIGGCGRV